MNVHDTNDRHHLFRLLRSLNDNVMQYIIVVIASRPELDIRTTFDTLEFRLSTHVVLLDSYDGMSDVLTYYNDEFERIRQTHPHRRIIPHDWPTGHVVHTLIDKSSGYFILPSIAIRYTSHPRRNPVEMLENVLATFSPSATGDADGENPLAELDALYTAPLHPPDANIPLLKRILHCIIQLRHRLPRISCSFLDANLQLTPGTVEITLCDLLSVLSVATSDQCITLHHEALEDFLLSPNRAQDLYQTVDETHLDLQYMQQGSELLVTRGLTDDVFNHDGTRSSLLQKLEGRDNKNAPSPSIEQLLQNLSPQVLVERVEAAERLARSQRRSDDDQLGTPALLFLFLRIAETKELYRHLLSLIDGEAQSILDSLQLVLDLPSSIVPPIARRVILKALLRLSKNSGLYPKCLTLLQVERSSQALDEGSYGEVYRGRFKAQNVALKVFKVRERTDISKLLTAVWREAILWSQLSHDNLLPFYGVYHLEDEHNRVCLVSPWMEQGNIVVYLKSNPQVDRLSLISDIAKGMSYLHNNEVVHGDLKGANILVSISGRACLADFGLSRVAASVTSLEKWTSTNATTAMGGTPRWQAPEFFEHEDAGKVVVSVKSDVYSFACVCYEIMTGHAPFYQIPQPFTVMLRVMNGVRPTKPLPNESAFVEFGLTDAIWGLMEECWCQDPDARPTAMEILRRPFLASLVDHRQEQKWEGLSAMQFRRAMSILSEGT